MAQSNSELNVEDFNALLEILISRQYTSTSRHHPEIIQALADIIEYVTYGDIKDEEMFLFFCEKQMMKVLLQLLRNYKMNSYIQIQILQTISVLSVSLKNLTSIYFLLSNDIINEIILFPFNFDKDEDLLPNYLSLMKSLSLLINETTIQFFIRLAVDGILEESLPMLEKSIQLLNDQEDSMVRIGAQVIILNILHANEVRSRNIICGHILLHDFSAACVNVLESLYRNLYHICIQVNTSTTTVDINIINRKQALEQQYELIIANIEDWLLFLKDIFQLEISPLSKHLMQTFVSDFIYLSILEPFIQLKAVYPDVKTINRLHINNHSNILQYYTRCQASLSILCTICEIQPHFDLLFAIFNAIFHPLSIFARKTHVYEFISFGGVIDMSDANLSSEINPYRNIFLELRCNQCEDRLFIQTSFVLYWISSIVLLTAEKCDIHCKNNETDVAIQKLLLLLHALCTLRILPYNSYFTTLYSTFLPSLVNVNSSMKTESPQIILALINDPDLLNIKAIKEWEYINKHIPIAFNSSEVNLFHTLDSNLRDFPAHSLLHLQVSCITIYQYVCAFGILNSFLKDDNEDEGEEKDILLENTTTTLMSDMKSFCTENLGQLLGVLKQFYEGVMNNLHDKAHGSTRLLIVDILLKEYKSLSKYTVGNCLLSFRGKNKFSELFMDICGKERRRTDEEEIQKDVRSFFLIHDIIILLSKRFAIPVGVSLDFLSAYSDESLLPKVGDQIDILEKLAFIVKLSRADRVPIPVECNFVLVIQSNMLVLAVLDDNTVFTSAFHHYPSMSRSIVFAVPLFRVSTSNLADEPHSSCSIPLHIHDCTEDKFPFLLLLEKNGDGSSWIVNLQFESLAIRDSAFTSIQKQKNELIDRALSIFGETSMVVGVEQGHFENDEDMSSNPE